MFQRNPTTSDFQFPISSGGSEDLHIASTRNVKVLCGDSAQVLKTITPNSIDIILTSPPYFNATNIARQSDRYKGVYDFDSVAKGCFDSLAPGGILVWNEGDLVHKKGPLKGSKSNTPERHLIAFEKIGFYTSDKLIWNKGSARYHYKHRHGSAYEPVYVFVKPPFDRKRVKVLEDRINKCEGERQATNYTSQDGSTHNKGRRVKTYAKEGKRNDIWGGGEENKYSPGYGKSYGKKYQKGHGGVMHMGLVMDLLKTYAQPVNDKPVIVLDPFAGTGTTLAEAIKLGMDAIGIEWSEVNCGVIKQLLEDTAMENKIKLNLTTPHSAPAKPVIDYAETDFSYLISMPVTAQQELPVVPIELKESDIQIQPEKRNLTIDDMRALANVESPERVKGLLPMEGVVTIYGRPKSNKTTFAKTMAIDISEGKPVLGVWEPVQCPVWYMNLEMAQAPWSKRFMGQVNGMKATGDNIVVRSVGRINLKTQAGQGEVVSEIKANGYKVIFIDPWGKSFIGSRSNDVEVSKVVNFLKDTARELHVLFVIVTHTNKVNNSIKGSTVLLEDSEIAFLIERAGDKVSSVMVKDSRHRQMDIHGHWEAEETPFFIREVEDIPNADFHLELVESPIGRQTRTVLTILAAGKAGYAELMEATGLKWKPLKKLLDDLESEGRVCIEVESRGAGGGSGGQPKRYSLVPQKTTEC